MKCPHCGNKESRIMECRAGDDCDRRTRLCRNCHETFTTIERLAVHAGRHAGWIEREVEPEPANVA